MSVFESEQIDFEKSLNSQQLKVVTESDGPSLVLAGAGSGKTRVLIYRLAWLIEQGIDPHNIFLVTFTNKAAAEMRHRAESLLNMDLHGLWMGTFHSMGARTLRRHAEELGYTRDFTIIDEEDAVGIIDQAIDDIGLKKQAGLLPKKNLILNIYSLSINSRRSIDDIVFDYYPHLEDTLVHIRRICALYKEKKQQNNVMDFDDLLTNWLRLLKTTPAGALYSEKFRYILVDEYQDTNKVQFEILQILAGHHNNILAVGDDAQSIYSFRAADIKNILQFPECFSNTKIFKLEINYRSSPQIVELANNSILNNKDQFEKTLQAELDDHTKPAMVKAADVYKQAEFINKRIYDLRLREMELKNIAILVRSRYQAMEIEMEMIKNRVPYIIRGGKRFFEQAHIKDVLAYIKSAQNPLDEQAFIRAVCIKNGIGPKGARKIYQLMIRDNVTLEELLKKTGAKQKESVRAFYCTINAIKEKTTPHDMLKVAIEEYHDYCYSSFENYQERMMDLEELLKMAGKYSDPAAFTEALGLYEGFDKPSHEVREQDHLIISTIHQAKGLEWDIVFVPGMSDIDFPHQRCLETRAKLEEERRLFYVAVTRAKKQLYLLYPEIKYTHNRGAMFSGPSMFIEELPSDLYEKIKAF